MSNGEVPPTKERLEYPPPETNTGLTQGRYFPNQNFEMHRYLLFIFLKLELLVELIFSCFYPQISGFLRVLHKQVGHLEVVNLTTLKAKWRGICLSLTHLEEILQSGN